MEENLWEQLKEIAQEAAGNAHCPYSGYAVGAALLTEDGHAVPGCNIENVSYGLTNCAERTAVFSAVAAGMKTGEARALALFVPGRPASPCGACRQVLVEFLSPETPVRSYGSDGQYQEWTVADLLPDAFDVGRDET